MFAPRTVALELTERRLRGLRLSLNTPVVATQELAVGPARAALLVHEEADGRPNVTIGVRSLRTGSVVLYSYEGDPREAGSLESAIDSALSFAESMGFLFDEDELASGAPDAKAQALGLFGDLMGQSGVASVASGEGTPDAPSEPVRAAEPAPAPPVADDDSPFGDPRDLERDGIPQFEGDPGVGATSVTYESPGAASRDAGSGYVPQFDGDTGSGGAFLDGEGLDGDGGAEDGPEFHDGLAHDEDFDLSDLEGFEPGPAEDARGDELVLDLGAEAVEIGPEEPAGARLTKFRGAPSVPAPGAEPPRAAPQGAAASADSASVSGRTTLAKLKLVRREREDGRPHPAARLFGAF